MNPETLFSICSTIVLPGWILLGFAPRWKWTERVAGSALISLLLALVYLYLIIVWFGTAEGGFGSLTDVARLFQTPQLLLAGWIHYLAFDLFIGAWEVRDARRLGIAHVLVIPCLILTFLFGPVGLLLYFVLRWTLGRQVLITAAG